MGKVAKKNAVATPMEVDSSDSSDSDVIEQARPPPKKHATPAPKKVVQPSSSDEDSEEDSSDSDAGKPVKKPAAKPATKSAAKTATKPSAAAKPAAKPSVEQSSTSSESSDESEEEVKKTAPKPASKVAESSDSSDEEEEEKPAAKAKLTPAAKPKSTPAATLAAKAKSTAGKTPAKKESSDDESDSDSEEEEEEKPKIKPKATPAAKPPAKDESSDSEDDEEEEEEKSKVKAKATPAKALAKEESSDDEDEEESEEEEEQKKPAAKKQKLENGKGVGTKPSEVQTPEPKGAGGGSKTLFVGNLAFSATQEDIEEFFGDCGEIANVRIATHEDGSMRGFGHVDFATEAAAKKALSKSGQHLCGRAIRCDLARERGTPGNTGTAEKRSFGGPATTVFVKGFDKDQEEETIRNKLKDFFKSCGEVTRVKIPTDRESGEIKGFAYIDFSNDDAQDKAKELNGNELDGYSLVVDAATSFSSPAGGGRGDRSGGRGWGGRGDRGRGRGDRGRGRGDRGGRSGGRGAPRQKISLSSAGKKTTFADD